MTKRALNQHRRLVIDQVAANDRLPGIGKDRVAKDFRRMRGAVSPIFTASKYSSCLRKLTSASAWRLFRGFNCLSKSCADTVTIACYMRARGFVLAAGPAQTKKAPPLGDASRAGHATGFCLSQNHFQGWTSTVGPRHDSAAVDCRINYPFAGAWTYTASSSASQRTG